MSQSFAGLAGKTILITGASSGIGAATALALGQAGARVAIAARRVDALEHLAAQLRDAGGEALSIAMDVTDEAQVQAAVARTVAHFGRLDGAFNNAGALGTPGPLEHTDSASFAAVMQTNVFGLFYSMKHEIAAMQAGGVIVNNASIAAQLGLPGLSPYAASKHAALGLTRSAALEGFTRSIRVNAINPGPTSTAMAAAGFGGYEGLEAALAQSPAGRPATPEEIAAPVLFLLSDAARYISGHGLNVDGGYSVP